MKKQKEKNQNLIGWGIGLLLLAGLIIWLAVADDKSQSGSKSSKYSASALTALESNFDFNTISMAGGNVSHRFEVKNEGEELVRIEKVYTSCMCTTASVIDASGNERGPFGMPGHAAPSSSNIEVKPKETVVVEAVFDPTAHGPSGVGLNQRAIYLETNSAKSPKLALSFQAMVTQ